MIKLAHIGILLKNICAQMTVDVPIELSWARQSSTMVSDYYPKAALAANPITNEVDISMNLFLHPCKSDADLHHEIILFTLIDLYLLDI